LFGTGFVIIAKSSITPPSVIGLFYCAVALLGITIGTLWEKRFGKTHHPVTSNLIGYCAGLLGVLPFMLALETMQINWTWQFGAALGYLVIAVGLLLAMIRAGDVSSVSSLFFMIPPFAAFIAWVLLGEVMPPIAWIGIAIAAIGVYIATRKQKTRN
jgi:drug/metabolite transporter (DMT)-like permease